MKTILYYLGVSALFTHELDAVLNLEWQLLFLVLSLPEATASAIFVGVHFPLFFALFYFGHHKSIKIRANFRFAASVVLVAHCALHFAFSNHDMYHFGGIISNLYITGAAIFGAAFIVLSWVEWRRK